MIKVVRKNKLKEAQRKFRSYMNDVSHLDFIEEQDSGEYCDSLGEDNEKLRKIIEQKHEAYTFYKRSDHAFNLEIAEANRNGKLELSRALETEMKGYGKEEMT